MMANYGPIGLLYMLSCTIISQESSKYLPVLLLNNLPFGIDYVPLSTSSLSPSISLSVFLQCFFFPGENEFSVAALS